MGASPHGNADLFVGSRLLLYSASRGAIREGVVFYFGAVLLYTLVFSVLLLQPASTRVGRAGRPRTSSVWGCGNFYNSCQEGRLPISEEKVDQVQRLLRSRREISLR